MKAKCHQINKPCGVHKTELSESLTVRAARLADALEQSVRGFIMASDQNLGDIELQVERQSRELQRQATEKAAQAKADATPPVCPVCRKALSRVRGDQERTFESRFGPITVRRARGYCRRCGKWRFPADRVLGLEDTAGYSPRVQEMAALLASKMPVSEASAVLEHLTGVKLPRATLDREARRQGERARKLRRQCDEQACGAAQRLVQPELVLEPYQMIIQMDAWNIRERDEWGKTQALRQRGQEPERWHWVYTGTCFRLDHYHAVEHLAAVGRALFGEDQDQLKGWLRPLAQQLKHQSAIKVVHQLEEILAELPAGAPAQAVQKEVNYFHEHQDRMDYRAGGRRGEPIGSGAIESTCRQTQCRFKRPGQYWSQQGDESLLCLETFWRNGRWHLLFPHNHQLDPSKN